MTVSLFSQLEVDQFKHDGYIFVRGMFNREEMQLLQTVSRADQQLQDKAWHVKDVGGVAAKITLWTTAADDVYGLVARSHRVVDRLEQLLGGEVYHYHSKMSMKEPFTGGAFEWHQDYGYWYQNQFLFPDMASCFIAVDKQTEENGCLQVLKGSHLLGRVQHGRFGDQTGADPERVDEARKVCELMNCIMEAGDALFFHANTLHGSSQNRSAQPRWSLICCYTAANNLSGKLEMHPCEQIRKVEDSALMSLASTSAADEPHPT